MSDSKESSPAETKPQEAKKESSNESTPRLTADEQKALAFFNNLDTRYRADPKFKDIMDKAIAGKYDELTPKQKEEVRHAQEEDEDLDPVSRVKKEIDEVKNANSKLADDVNKFRDAFAWDKVTSVRHDINVKYEQAFANLAEEKGYAYGSHAYDALFDSGIKEANMLARKYGLVGDDGSPDPLVKFTPELVKEAFERAIDKHKKMGFDISEQQKREAIARREEKLKRDNDRWNPYLDKKKIATREGRAAQLESMFNQRLRDLGIDRKSMRFN